MSSHQCLLKHVCGHSEPASIYDQVRSDCRSSLLPLKRAQLPHQLHLPMLPAHLLPSLVTHQGPAPATQHHWMSHLLAPAAHLKGWTADLQSIRPIGMQDRPHPSPALRRHKMIFRYPGQSPAPHTMTGALTHTSDIMQARCTALF